MNLDEKCWCCGVRIDDPLYLYCIPCDGANCNGQYPPCQIPDARVAA